MTELEIKDNNVKNLIKDTFEDVLDEIDVDIYSIHKQDGEYVAGLSFYSPAGEDVVVDFFFDGSLGDFTYQFRQYAAGFDVDEHVKLWIDGMGKNGVPSTIRELVEDAEDIEAILNEIADLLDDTLENLKENSLDDLVNAAESKKTELEEDREDIERTEHDDFEK